MPSLTHVKKAIILNDVTKATSEELGKSHNLLCNNNDNHKSV